MLSHFFTTRTSLKFTQAKRGWLKTVINPQPKESGAGHRKPRPQQTFLALEDLTTTWFPPGFGHMAYEAPAILNAQNFHFSSQMTTSFVLKIKSPGETVSFLQAKAQALGFKWPVQSALPTSWRHGGATCLEIQSGNRPRACSAQPSGTPLLHACLSTFSLFKTWPYWGL